MHANAVQEVTYFVAPGVLVTSARFVVGSQLYPISGITSVSAQTKLGDRLIWYIGASLFLLPAIAIVVGGLLFGSLTVATFAVPLIVIGVIVVLIGRSVRDVHSVWITTSGMQIAAITHRDLGAIQQVVSALHQAIVSRQ